MFTQGAVVLLKAAPSLDVLAEALREYQPIRRDGLGQDDPWLSSGSELVLPLGLAAGGHIIIDVVNAAWPDDMGEADPDSPLHVAWSSGLFGAHVLPGALARASEQRWGWPEAPLLVQNHAAFVRVRVTYALGSRERVDDAEQRAGEGAEPGDIVAAAAPEERDAIGELQALTEVAHRVGNATQALAFFNPAAETLRAFAQVADGLEMLKREHYLPLELWMNVRLYQLDESDELVLMDCVGLRQFSRPDLEAIFPADNYELDEVDFFLREIAARMIGPEGIPPAGTQVTGPNESRWTFHTGQRTLAEPDRSFLRLMPNELSDLAMRLSFFGMT